MFSLIMSKMHTSQNKTKLDVRLLPLMLFFYNNHKPCWQPVICSDCRLFGTLWLSSAAATRRLILPGGDVVSGRDGDAPPRRSVPAAVRIPGEDALPAGVAVAAAVGQRQPLDLHGCANIQVPLEEGRCITLCVFWSDHYSVASRLNQPGLLF